ncbi:MAG: tetratricopeptide repeat-containing glycosyltransferase family protein [Xanthobacteraceae bacterium]
MFFALADSARRPGANACVCEEERSQSSDGKNRGRLKRAAIGLTAGRETGFRGRFRSLDARQREGFVEEYVAERSVPSQPTAITITSWLIEAFAQHQAGQWAEAEKIYHKILAAQPDHLDSLHLLGVMAYERGEFARALDQIGLILAKDPDNSLALNHRGLALLALKRFDDALASYDRALALRPDYAEAHCNRGMVLFELKAPEEALASYDRALALRPDFVEAQVHRGNALRKLKRFEEALASCERTLELWPDRAAAYGNRAIVLHELRRFEEALADYDRAFAIEPDYLDALCNRGAPLYELGRFEEALASYDRALAVRPDFADAHYNEAHSRLLTGDLRRGFEKFEWRWKIEPYASFKREFAQPQWVGREEIAGKTILLHAADGFGDTIHLCRYAPLVTARGARVILEVQKPLQELMGSLAGGERILARGDALPDFDLQCPLLSLPRAFGTELATIPCATPYLFVPPSRTASWKARLGPRHRPRIGLGWSGDPSHSNDRNRSIALDRLLPLLTEVDATFVSVQQEVRDGDAAVLQSSSDIRHFGAELKDFSDTAALISNLDLVISVDTSVAHLAGALAKPVWILLTFLPDWRWLLDREDSPWYPTARLFRQDDTRTWDDVIARVRAALQDFVRGG